MPCLPCRRAPPRSPGISRGLDNRRTGLIGPYDRAYIQVVTLLLLFAFVAGAGTAISPVRAAGAAGAAVGRRHRRAAAAAGDRHRARRPRSRSRSPASPRWSTASGSADERAARRSRWSCCSRSAWRCWRRGWPTGWRRRCRGSRASARESGGDGFWSGLAVGAALGFVYAPCAGPILAAVISVGAASGSSVAIAIAYSLGSAVVLFALMLGGRRLMERVRGPGAPVRAGRGHARSPRSRSPPTLDVRFQTALADHFPSALVNPTGSIERSHAVSERLAEAARLAERASPRPPATLAPRSCRCSARRPDFTGNERWFNPRSR